MPYMIPTRGVIPKVTGYLRLHGGVGKALLAWTGPWPPPEELIAVRGAMTGGVAYNVPGQLAEETLAEARELGAAIDTYDRVAVSGLSDGVIEQSPHVVRAAEYKVR